MTKAQRRQISALANLRAVYADKQTPRFKAALKAVLKKHVEAAAARAAAGDTPLVSKDILASWTRDLIAAQRKPLAFMAAHGFELAGEELGTKPKGKSASQPRALASGPLPHGRGSDYSASEPRALASGPLPHGRGSEFHGKAVIAGVEVPDDPANFLRNADWKNLEKWIKTTAESASATTAERLKRIFDAASAYFDKEKNRGRTPAEIAKQILAEGLAQTDARARMLAQTGAIWAYGEGAVQRYAAENIAVVEWLTADDDLRCPFCAEMNGKRVETQDAFFSSGDKFQVGEGVLKIPGGVKGFDVRHPPLHPNCRCTLIPVV